MPISKPIHFVYPLLLVVLLFAACSPKTWHHLPAYQFATKQDVPNYADLQYWAAHPAKWDPSDSLPKKLRNSKSANPEIDVFFIHPTSLTDQNDTSWNAPIQDPVLNAKTDYSSILYQASAFNANARVFAPRYRQAHIRAFYTTDSVRAAQAFELAYNDILQAFRYYLQVENKNRPFIIATHSQGTLHGAKLIKDTIEQTVLKNRLVAAYLIGLPVPTDYFQSIPACNSPQQTGCIISWRTYKRGTTDDPILNQEKFRAIVINPLSWDTTTARIHRHQNSGAVLKNFKKIKPHITDAQIHKNILWSRKPKFFGNFVLTTKNYHVGDINLFYQSIRNNVAQRIQAFWKK